MKGAVSTVILLLTVAIIATLLVYNYSIPIEKPTLRQKIVTGRAISDISATAPAECKTYYCDTICDAPKKDCDSVGGGYVDKPPPEGSLVTCNEVQTLGYPGSPSCKTATVSKSSYEGSCEGYCNQENIKTPDGCYCDSACEKQSPPDCCTGTKGYQSTCTKSEVVGGEILPGAGKAILKVGGKVSIYTGPVGVVMQEVTLEKVSPAGATVKVINYIKKTEETIYDLTQGTTAIIAGLDVFVQSLSSDSATLWIGAEFAESPTSGKPNFVIDDIEYNYIKTGPGETTEKGILAKKKIWTTVVVIPSKEDRYVLLDENGKVKDIDKYGNDFVWGIKLYVKVSNKGSAIYDEFISKVQLLAKDSSEWETVASEKFVLTKTSDTIIFDYIDLFDMHEGTNKFRILLDSKSQIKESNEDDNQYLFDIPVKKI